jgi:hypothetical protein
MPISEEKQQRSLQAIAALKALRDEYNDVLTVLDYVTLNDIAKHDIDSDDSGRADGVLSDADLEGILWRLGKHANSAQTSLDLLPALVQYAIDEHERRGDLQP